MSQKRVLVLCGGLLLMFALVLCRVFWISTDTGYAANASGQSVSEVALPRARGNFLDRSGKLLTGLTKQWYALCVPGDSSYATLFPFVPFAEQTKLYERRNSSTPFLVAVNRDLSAQGIYSYAGAVRYLPLPIAPHLVGYLDGTGHGVAGLEYAYDDLLYQTGDASLVECVTTAQGRLLTGTDPVLHTQAKGTGQDVQLALDAEIQRACEGIAQQYLPRGCIVVADAADNGILASVSMPEFTPGDIARSIRANDTSLINRPLAAFNAGSVFKVVLAVAAYHAGWEWFSTECTSSITVGDQSYRCAQGRAHGTVNLRRALQESCNCYFIELGARLGADRILQAARALGFGAPTPVAPGLKGGAGILPAPATLESDGQLAMFSFGQGELTVTPLQITAMMNVIASDGQYRPPVVVRALTGQGNGATAAPLPTAAPSAVCGSSTAAILRDMLVTVVEEGIGGEAEPAQGGAGGKTGTAQTGQYQPDGRELLNYWFAGFFPAENPRYTVTVLQDGVLPPAHSSAELFAMVADAILAMESG